MLHWCEKGTVTMLSEQLEWFTLAPESLAQLTHILVASEQHKMSEEIGVFCPQNHGFKWLFIRRKVLFQEQFMISEQFMSIHFWTGNWFKTQVITGRPHLYAAKISPTAFLRLACAQHAFTDYMCCLQLCFDCTHCIPKVSCRRGLHGTCCSIGTFFWQGICLHCRVCHTRHKSVSIYHSKNSLGLLYLQAALESWHKLPLSQDPERGRCSFCSAEFMDICQLKKKVPRRSNIFLYLTLGAFFSFSFLALCILSVALYALPV